MLFTLKKVLGGMMLPLPLLLLLIALGIALLWFRADVAAVEPATGRR